MNKIKIIYKIITNPSLTKALLFQCANGYLNEIGWINSWIKKSPINKEGMPLPWVTYPFIDFIEKRLTKQIDIFEYGAGNSTLYYASKVNSITSVEHDKDWFDKISATMPNNSKLIYQELVYGGEYSEMAKTQKLKYQLIIIDGRDRVNCIKNSLDALAVDGVIVLDDSEREDYIKGYELLINNGFKYIDFWGISPGYFFKKCTTLFYKNNNILGV